MASYYQHTHTVRTQINYSFICEQCHQNSGMLTAVFEEQAEKNKRTKTLTDQEKHELHQRASEMLGKKVERSKADSAQYEFAREFKDKCPHCGKPQLRAVKNTGSNPLARHWRRCARAVALPCNEQPAFPTLFSGLLIVGGIHPVCHQKKQNPRRCRNPRAGNILAEYINQNIDSAGQQLASRFFYVRKGCFHAGPQSIIEAMGRRRAQNQKKEGPA